MSKLAGDTQMTMVERRARLWSSRPADESADVSLYVDNFDRYGRTYGALAGVAILMLWLWITALIVLVGAEVNAEAEHQTIRDTTVGGPRPMGERNAVKADTRPDAEHRERKRA